LTLSNTYSFLIVYNNNNNNNIYLLQLGCYPVAVVIYRQMLVDKCMYMPGMATTQLVGVTGEAPKASCQKQYSKIPINSMLNRHFVDSPASSV